MTKNPTVSVIIPAYNRAHLIGRAIQSVWIKYMKTSKLSWMMTLLQMRQKR